MNKNLNKLSTFILNSFSSITNHQVINNELTISTKISKVKNLLSELKKKDENVKSLEDSKTDIGWGHQIRSYVLQPYRLVKDLRNNYESTNPDSVLNGDIDEFLENSLFRSKGKNK